MSRSRILSNASLGFVGGVFPGILAKVLLPYLLLKLSSRELFSNVSVFGLIGVTPLRFGMFALTARQIFLGIGFYDFTRERRPNPPHEPQNRHIDYQRLAQVEVQGLNARKKLGVFFQDRRKTLIGQYVIPWG